MEKGNTVLLIDDAATVRMMQRRILEERGYVIVGEASSGLEGFDMYAQLKPDVTILDITMPIMDGLETLRKINARYPEAKVVMCSATWMLNTVLEALMCGADDFVSKPFQRERFLFTVENVLSESRVFDTYLLSQLIEESERMGKILISQDQISELITYITEHEFSQYTVQEVLENLGLFYQQHQTADNTLEKILEGQERIITLLEAVMKKLG